MGSNLYMQTRKNAPYNRKHFSSISEQKAVISIAGDGERTANYYSLLTSILAASVVLYKSNGDYSKCCGIAGVITKDSSGGNARELLLESLMILKNRGYDSAGLATTSSDVNNNTMLQNLRAMVKKQIQLN